MLTDLFNSNTDIPAETDISKPAEVTTETLVGVVEMSEDTFNDSDDKRIECLQHDAEILATMFENRFDVAEKTIDSSAKVPEKPVEKYSDILTNTVNINTDRSAESESDDVLFSTVSKSNTQTPAKPELADDLFASLFKSATDIPTVESETLKPEETVDCDNTTLIRWL